MSRTIGPAGVLSRRLPFYYGWIVVAVGFVTLGLGYTARSTFSLLFPPILDEFGWDRGTTALVFSVGFASAALYAPLLGHWLDKYGPGIVLPFGTAITSAGFMLTTVSTEVWHFVVSLGALVVGASTLFAYNAHFVFIPNWFEARRGLALGLCAAGTGVISILALPLFQETIDGAGWRASCYYFAAVLMLVVFPLTALLQRRQPSDLGLQPDGMPTERVCGATSGPRLRVVDEAWASIEWTLLRALATLRFWLVALAAGSALFVWYGIVVHQTRYLLDLGFDSSLAAFALGAVPMCGVVGQIGFGWLSDRIGREWVWTISVGGFVVTCALLLALEHHPSVFLIFVMVAAQGFFGFALVTVYGSVPADIFQGRHYGVIYGSIAIAGNIGAAFGPWAYGYLYDLTGSYASAFWLSIAVCVLSIISMWLAAPRKVRSVRRSAAA